MSISSAAPRLIDAPASDSARQITPLAYIDGYDAVLNGDYAYVAFKETDLASGPSPAWRVRIASKGTAGAVFEPEAMRLQARAAGAQGKPYFVWGYRFEPSPADPRCIEFRVHVKDGLPAAIEMFLQLRKADGSAAPAASTTFAWPA